MEQITREELKEIAELLFKASDIVHDFAHYELADKLNQQPQGGEDE